MSGNSCETDLKHPLKICPPIPCSRPHPNRPAARPRAPTAPGETRAGPWPRTAPRRRLSGGPAAHSPRPCRRRRPGSAPQSGRALPADALSPPPAEPRVRPRRHLHAQSLGGRAGAAGGRSPGGPRSHVAPRPPEPYPARGPACHERPLTFSCPTSRRNCSRFRAPPPRRAAAEARAMRPPIRAGAGRSRPRGRSLTLHPFSGPSASALRPLRPPLPRAGVRRPLRPVCHLPASVAAPWA